jgi:hypothetical protein
MALLGGVFGSRRAFGIRLQSAATTISIHPHCGWRRAKSESKVAGMKVNTLQILTSLLNFYLKPDITPINFYQKKGPYKLFWGR